MQGALVDVMYWVPCWDQVALQTLAGALRTGSPQPAHAHKLLLALVYRYYRLYVIPILLATPTRTLPSCPPPPPPKKKDHENHDNFFFF